MKPLFTQNTASTTSAVPEEEYLLLKALNEALLQLLNTNDVEEALASAFRIVCEALGCDGAYLYDYQSIEKDKVIANTTFCLRYIENKWQLLPPHLVEFPIETPTIHQRFNAMMNDDTTTLALNQHNPEKLKALNKANEIESYLSFRIFIDGEVWGGVSFVSRVPDLQWAQNRRTLLAPFAITVGNFLARKQTEIRIIEQRDYLRQILDASPEPIFVRNLDGVITLANKSMAEGNGLAHPDEIIGKNIRLFLFHDDHVKQMEEEDLLLLSGEKKQLEVIKQVANQEGKIHYLRSSKSILNDKEGNIIGIVNILHNITPIQEAQIALQHSENILKATINALPDLKFRLRKDGTYLNFYQPDNESITPYAPASIILGNKVQNVMPEGLGFTFLEKIQEAIQESAVKIHEYEINIPGGGLEYREARFSPINEEEVISVVRNISERKRAEKALKESQERYLNFIKHSHDGIYYMNCGKPISIYLSFDEMAVLFYENAYIDECNEAMARMYGITVENLRGTTAITLHGGEHFEENVESFKDLIKNGFRVADAETIEPDANGNFKYFLNNAVGVIENEHLVGFWGTQIDITERRQAQQREQSRTYVLELLSQGASSDTILEAIVQGVEQYQAGIICSILLLDNEKKQLWTACAPSLPAFYNEAINGIEIGMGVGSCGTATYTGERVVVEDILTHPYWENYKELAARADLRACWSEPIKDSSSNVLGSFAIYHRFVSTPAPNDIELIKQAAGLVSITLNKFHTEEVLRASEEKFHSMVHNISGIISLLDEKGIIMYESSSIKQVLGYDEYELIGRNVFEFVHPDDIPHIVQKFQEATIRDGSGPIVEFRFLNKAGDYIQLEAQGNNQLHNSAIKGIIVNSRDISERKQAERDLLENRSLLKAIIDALPDLKFRVSKEGLFLDYYESDYENESPIMLPAEFIGKNLYDILPSFVAETGINSIRIAIEQRRVDTFEYFIPLEHEIAYYEGRVSPFGGEEAIVTVRNITVQKKAEIALQEKLRELDEKNKQLTQYIDSNFELEHFAYIASHDLREPIRTVHSFAQLLKKKYEHSLDQDGIKYLNFIIYSALNMNQLIDDLLTYSRVSSEARILHSLNLKNILTDVIDSLTSFIKEKDASIHINEIPFMIQANTIKIKQLFQNLITNAIKFHHPERKPIVHISGIEQDEHWLFEVKDNGIGIANNMQEKIFQLFKKIHTQPEHHGTGIGLALCKRIVDNHEGEIWVESQPDVGSSFYFTIKKA